MYMSPADIEALYASIHRLAQYHVPDCTIEQVRKTANQYHDRSNTRLHHAFYLYWLLSEGQLEGTMAGKFLEIVRRLVDDARENEADKVIAKPSLKDYWKA